MGTRSVARTFIAAVALATTGLAALITSPAAAAGGCGADCISNVSISQRLYAKAAADITVDTTANAYVTAEIVAGNGAVVTAVGDVPGSLTKLHRLNTANLLEQGVTYTVRIKATDSQGRTFTETRSVRGLKRTVMLDIGKVTVTDDGDYGAGEMISWVKLGADYHELLWKRSMTAPATLNLSFSAQFTKVSNTSKITVEMVDDDHDFGEYCLWYPKWITVIEACADRTTASSASSFSITKGVTEGSFSVTGSGPVDFTVTGTYEAIVG